MKKYIINGIKSVITLFVLTAICNYLYKWNHLDNVFGPTITFWQWMAVIIIVQSLIPDKEVFSTAKKDNDDK
jgi:hypothetical protein